MSLSLKLRPTRPISRRWRRSSPELFGIESLPSWEDIRAATIAKLDLTEMLVGILGSVTSFGSAIFLVVVYAFFLVAERGSLADKLAAAFPQGDQANRTARLIDDINRRIGDYLAVKTLINVILGVVSYLIMLFMGLDFARVLGRPDRARQLHSLCRHARGPLPDRLFARPVRLAHDHADPRGAAYLGAASSPTTCSSRSCSRGSSISARSSSSWRCRCGRRCGGCPARSSQSR